MEKKVIKNFIIYSIPNILTQVLPIFVLPITTKYLTITDFGLIALFSVLVLPFKAIIQFGSSYVINSTWFKINTETRKELVFLLLMISIIFTIITVIVISLFYDLIFSFLVGIQWKNIKDLYWLLIINVFLLLPEEIFLSWAVIEKKAVLNSVVSLTKIILSTITMLILTIITKNYKLIIIGKVFSESLAYVFQFYALFRVSKINFRKDLLSHIFKISYPTFFQQFITNLKIQFDKLYINRLFGTDQLALYNFSDRFNVAFLSINKNYERSYSPHLYEQLANNKIQFANLKRTLMFWFIVAYFFSILVIIFGRWFISVFTNNVYNDAYPYIVLYLTVLLLPTIFMADIVVLIHFQKTKFLMFSFLIESIVAIISCILFIPKFGVIGGIISIWLGRLIYFILFFIKKRELIKEPFIEYTVLPYVVFFHLVVTLKVFFKFKYSEILLIISFIILLLDFFIRNYKFIFNYLKYIFKKIRKINF